MAANTLDATLEMGQRHQEPVLPGERLVEIKYQGKFCHKPFSWFEVVPNGDVMICCPTWINKMTIGNMLEQSPDEVWNSAKACEIRESIILGNYRFCNSAYCPLLQNNASGLPDCKAIPVRYKKIYGNNEYKLDFGPETLNLSYDKSCNLACPSCRNRIIVSSGDILDKAMAIQNRLLNSSLLRDAKTLIVTGTGDPFAGPVYRDLLKRISKSRYPNLKLHIMTNGQLLNQNVWSKYSEAMEMVRSIAVSVDAATEETYRTLRGGSFATLRKNLCFLSERRAEGKFERFTISMVVQTANYQEMKAFAQMGIALNCDCVQFGKIIDWGTYKHFDNVAIWKKTHPEHSRFAGPDGILSDPIFSHPKVDIGNMRDCLESHRIETVRNNQSKDHAQ